jgi:uncharacterized protein involved in outer membrane biogenesis
MPSYSRRWVKAARYFAYCAAGLAVLVVAAALFLPEILDTLAVRAEIQRILSQAVRGEVAWEELRIRILPSPHGALRKARLEIPQVASVSADEASAHLRLWPLIHGRVEISSVTVTRPVIRISIVPAPTVERKAQEKEPATHLVGLYRSAMGPVVDAVRKFAPDTVVAIEDAELEVHVPGALPMNLSKLSLSAHAGAEAMALEATATSEYWSSLELAARVEYADLSAKASLSATNIKPQAWLERYLGKMPVGVSMADVRLRLEARTDARTSLECEIDARTDSLGIAHAGERVDIPDVGVKGSVKVGAQETVIGVNEIRLGGSRLMAGEARLSAKDGAVSGHSDYDLDLEQGMDYTRRLLPADQRAVLAPLRRVTGRAQGRVTLALAPPDWRVGVDVHRSDAAVEISDFAGAVRFASGKVEIDRQKVKLERFALSTPSAKALLSDLKYLFKDGSAAGDARIEFDVAQWLEITRRVQAQAVRDVIASIETATGRIEGDLKFTFSRDDWKFALDGPKSDATLGVRQLPGPLRIAGLSVEASPAAVTIHRSAVTLLDASVVASITLDELKAGPRARGSIAEGNLGEKFLAWVWQLAKLPDRYEPATPIRVAAPLFSWSRTGGVEVQATAQFDAGPAVAVELGWTPAALDVRRATVKDVRSDAVMAARIAGSALEGRFSGSLSSASIAAMLASAKVPAGAVAGDLRFAFDRDNPQRASAEGSLKGEGIDLAWLIGRPVTIERLDLVADGASLRIHDATINWAGQRATKRGEVRRGASGLVIDAQLDSPGIILDALFEPGAAAPGAKPAVNGARPKPRAAEIEKPLRIWPLPVTGRIEMRSDFIRSGRHHFASVAGNLEIEERRMRLDLKRAELCGISLPLTLEATPQGYSASARISAQKQQLERTAHCLSEARVLITGTYDLKADVSTQGTRAELLQNLKGEIRAEVRDGRVMKFALLGNILSMGNVASLMKEGGPRLDEAGFPYRELIVSGNVAEGRFNLLEGAFRSDALGLAADGWVSLTDYSSRLTVLVAPFSRLDEFVRNVPLVGYIIGGTFTSVPVGVSGDIRDPLVVPLGPAAVTSHLLSIFERTLKLPAKLITPAEAK